MIVGESDLSGNDAEQVMLVPNNEPKPPPKPAVATPISMADLPPLDRSVRERVQLAPGQKQFPQLALGQKQYSVGTREYSQVSSLLRSSISRIFRSKMSGILSDSEFRQLLDSVTLQERVDSDGESHPVTPIQQCSTNTEHDFYFELSRDNLDVVGPFHIVFEL